MFAENAYSDLKDEIEIAHYQFEQMQNDPNVDAATRGEAEQFLRGMVEALYGLENDKREAEKAIKKLVGEMERASANEEERALREQFNENV